MADKNTAAVQPQQNKKTEFTPAKIEGIPAAEWEKMTLEQKIAARESNVTLTEEQADNLETLEDAKHHKDMLRKLTNSRMPRALNVIKSFAGLKIHNPTDAQAKAITDALDGAVQAVKDAFSGKDAGFQLPD